MSDVERAESIAESGFKNDRNPLDTAGMDTDDEEWIGNNPQYEDYIMDHYRYLEKKESVEEAAEAAKKEAEEAAKTEVAKKRLAFSKIYHKRLGADSSLKGNFEVGVLGKISEDIKTAGKGKKKKKSKKPKKKKAKKSKKKSKKSRVR